jgi:hypothetical protein
MYRLSRMNKEGELTLRSKQLEVSLYRELQGSTADPFSSTLHPC